MKKNIKQEKKQIRNIGYLRVSTQDQDNEKNKADILSFANDKDFGKIEFVEEICSGKISWKNRKINAVIDELSEGDRIVVPELSRLGRSMLDIIELISIAKRKGIAIYAIKGGIEQRGWELNGDSIQSKVMLMVFTMVSEIERDLISLRTREGMRAAKAMGRMLGRPRGPGKSKLDPFKEEIIALLKNRSPKTFVAKRYKSTAANLDHWLKKNNIDAKPREEQS